MNPNTVASGQVRTRVSRPRGGHARTARTRSWLRSRRVMPVPNHCHAETRFTQALRSDRLRTADVSNQDTFRALPLGQRGFLPVRSLMSELVLRFEHMVGR